MPKETPAPVEKLTASQFLDSLYGEIIGNLEKRGGQVIREFGPQKGINWTEWTSYGSSTRNHPLLDLEKAILVRDKKKMFLLTLGRGKRHRYDPHEETLRLQFGFSPRDNVLDPKREQYPIERLRYFVEPQGFIHGYGEFYAFRDFDGQEKLGINCWANC